MSAEPEIDSGSVCFSGHPLILVAEGYALCSDGPATWFVWRLSPPAVAGWLHAWIMGRDNNKVPAWASRGRFDSRSEALDFIQRDIEAHRHLPFDEERERARLMPV